MVDANSNSGGKKEESKWGNNASGYTNKWNCHTGNVLVFKKDGVSVFAGGSSRSAEPSEVNVVLDLAEIGKYKDFTKPAKLSWRDFIPDGWNSKEKLLVPPPPPEPPTVLSLKIADMHAPLDVPKEFWIALWEDLKARAPISVLVMCQGGHGRTGVVLTCLLGASKFKLGLDENGHKVNPIIWLRDEYCENAVESEEQLVYCGKMWNIPIKVKGSKQSSYTSNSYTPKPPYTPLVRTENNKSLTILKKCEECGESNNSVQKSPGNGKLECTPCWDKRMAKFKGGNVNKPKLETNYTSKFCNSCGRIDEFCKCEEKEDSNNSIHSLTQEAWDASQTNETFSSEI